MRSPTKSAERRIVFTDLDGTLIDFDSYSTDVTTSAVSSLVDGGIPIVFCSSKTRLEQQAILGEFGIATPCIVENGSGIYIPESAHYPDASCGKRLENGDRLISLGVPSSRIREAIEELAQDMSIDFRPYSALSIEEISATTGLSAEAAQRAQQRDFSETLTASLPASTWEEVNRRLAQSGLQCLCGGRFYTVTSAGCDKGQAVKEVMSAYRAGGQAEWTVVAVGDSANDVDMLKAADLPFLVQRPDGSWFDIDLPNLQRAQGIGPKGWVRMAEIALGYSPDQRD